jgi:hypothetical protein
MIEAFDDDKKDLYGLAKFGKYAVTSDTKYTLGR